jgi:hypothetical protein
MHHQRTGTSLEFTSSPVLSPLQLVMDRHLQVRRRRRRRRHRLRQQLRPRPLHTLQQPPLHPPHPLLLVLCRLSMANAEVSLNKIRYFFRGTDSNSPGNGYTGPTTCASPYTCKAISPPYYSQASTFIHNKQTQQPKPYYSVCKHPPFLAGMIVMTTLLKSPVVSNYFTFRGFGWFARILYWKSFYVIFLRQRTQSVNVRWPQSFQSKYRSTSWCSRCYATWSWY